MLDRVINIFRSIFYKMSIYRIADSFQQLNINNLLGFF